MRHASNCCKLHSEPYKTCLISESHIACILNVVWNFEVGFFHRLFEMAANVFCHWACAALTGHAQKKLILHWVFIVDWARLRERAWARLSHSYHANTNTCHFMAQKVLGSLRLRLNAPAEILLMKCPRVKPRDLHQSSLAIALYFPDANTKCKTLNLHNKY